MGSVFEGGCEVTNLHLSDEVERLKRSIIRLKYERLALIEALRSRSCCDSKGYFDYDVARWFDPGRPYADFPDSSVLTSREYNTALKKFKEKIK